MSREPEAAKQADQTRAYQTGTDRTGDMQDVGDADAAHRTRRASGDAVTRRCHSVIKIKI